MPWSRPAPPAPLSASPVVFSCWPTLWRTPPPRPISVAPFVLDRSAARGHLGLAYLLRRTNLIAALAEATAALDADPNLFDALQLRALLNAHLGHASATDDIDRLLQYPTAHRYYNAACALAILSQKDQNLRLTARSLTMLRRAIEAGFPREGIEQDPDLESLRGRAEFKAMMKEGNAPKG